VLVAGAGAVVIAAGTTAAVLTLRGGGDPPPAPAAPALDRDPVAKPLNVMNAPANCGVPSATVRRVTRMNLPSNSSGDSCTWSSPGGAPHQRTLDVATTVVEATNDDVSPAGAAMAEFDTRLDEMRGTRVPVTGLGDEAYTSYDGRAQFVLFRAGNAVTELDFAGVELGHATARRLAAKAVRHGAFTVAAAVARTLGSSAAAPHAGSPPSPSPITRRFSACDAVPRDVTKRFVPDQVVPPNHLVGPDLNSLIPKPVVSACNWTAQGRSLKVRIESAVGGAAATRSVAREYLRRHYNGRVNGRFDALRGPGEQAFSRFTSNDELREDTETNLGQVVFRVRNVLVTVWYGNDALGQPDDEKLSVEEARNGAYAVAAQVARAVHV
jgi:hypothetical protein